MIKRLPLDTVILLTVMAIVFLCFVIFFVLYSSSSAAAQTKTQAQKRAEIIDDYKRRMKETLTPYMGDKKLLQAKKTQLLKEFNTEFSTNIFFDAEGVREAIRELAHYTPEA